MAKPKKPKKQLERKIKAAPAKPVAGMPCECGSDDAYWHGSEEGLREYVCDDCWRDRPRRNTRRELSAWLDRHGYRTAHASKHKILPHIPDPH
jgi:hypothetical protein